MSSKVSRRISSASEMDTRLNLVEPFQNVESQDPQGPFSALRKAPSSGYGRGYPRGVIPRSYPDSGRWTTGATKPSNVEITNAITPARAAEYQGSALKGVSGNANAHAE